MDTFLLGVLLPQGLAVAGIYYATTRLVGVAEYLPDAVSRAVFPRLSRDSTADPARASSTLAAATKELLALGIAIPFGFALVGSWLLGFLYGPTFAEYTWLLVAFGMAILPFRYVGLIFGFRADGRRTPDPPHASIGHRGGGVTHPQHRADPHDRVAGALIAVAVNWANYCALLVVDVRRIFGRTLWLRDVVNPLGSAIVAFLVGVVVQTVVGGRLGDPLAGLAFAGVFAIGMFSPAIRDRFGSKSESMNPVDENGRGSVLPRYQRLRPSCHSHTRRTLSSSETPGDQPKVWRASSISRTIPWTSNGRAG